MKISHKRQIKRRNKCDVRGMVITSPYFTSKTTFMYHLAVSLLCDMNVADIGPLQALPSDGDFNRFLGGPISLAHVVALNALTLVVCQLPSTLVTAMYISQ